MSDNAESINGWKPPVIRGDYGDTPRIATQNDVDRMQSELSALRQFAGAAKRAAVDLNLNMARIDNQASGSQ